MTDDAGGPLAVDAPSTSDGSDSVDRVPPSVELDGPAPGTEAPKWMSMLRTKRKKRLDYLDDLLRSLDIAIFCQLSTLYYLDCSLFLFAVRAIPHFVQQTPKPSDFPPSPLGNISQRPYVPTIFMVNLICSIWHLCAPAPSAGEATRGYLHGGLLIDFVGQAGPISKFRLLTLDVLIFVLQIVMLSVTATRFEVEESLKDQDREAPEQSGQDLDSEERGVHREENRENIEVSSESGIELRNLLTSTSQEVDVDGEASDILTAQAEDSSKHFSDHLDNGENVVAEVYILDLIKSRMSKRGMG